MTFNDFKAYRRIMQPVLELKKWRENKVSNKFWSNIGFTILIVGACLIGSCKVVHAQEFSDTQIANAIRKAEGTWTYGIKTVTCNSEAECRKVTLRTIRNNRIRFRKFGYRKYSNFINFLGSRYCPIGATNDPEGLNRNWIKNVTFFLKEGI